MESHCQPDQCLDCPGRLVCSCLKITEEQLLTALDTLQIRTLRELRRQTGAGDGCTACHRRLELYLERSAYSAAS